jgi:hypothetical protein
MMPPNPELINAAAVLGGLWVLAKMANELMAFWQRISGKASPMNVSPQPLSVQAHPEYVTRGEFNEHKINVRGDLEKLNKTLEKRFDRLTDDREKSIKGLNDGIADVKKEIKSDVEKLDKNMADRLKEGNHRMEEHDKDIAALKAIQAKGGKP